MPTKKELTLGQAIELRLGLSQLDGFHKVVNDKPVVVPYKIKDSVRRKIVFNLRSLKPFVEDGDDIRLAIVKSVASEETPGYIDEFDGPRNAQANERWRTERRTNKRVIELEMLDRSDLFDSDKNPIPGTVEEALTLVLNDVKEAQPTGEGGEE